MDKEKFMAIFGSHYIVQDPEELYWLFHEVEKTKPKIILEIGIESGGSFRFWLELLAIEGIAIAVDSCDIEKSAGAYVRPFAEQKKIMLYFIRGKSQDPHIVKIVGNILQGRKLDFLFIDAEHTNEAVKQDFNNYSVFVRSGGLVGFHDINTMKDFWNNLQGMKASKTDAMGTGIWWKP